MEPILTVKDLSVSFSTRSGEFDAVKHVSFELGKGETLGIVGESGSGRECYRPNHHEIDSLPAFEGQKRRNYFSRARPAE